MKRNVKKIVSCLVSAMMMSTFVGTNLVLADDTTDDSTNAKSRVSVHDPSIIKSNDGTYYVFGSHIDAAKSTDLQNWTVFTNGYTTPDNTIYGDLSENLAGSFEWAGENDCDSKGGYSVWAPSAIWNPDYVNEDGTKGAYMMYYCTSSTYKRSCIGYAVSQNIEGPYTYVDTILYSGFTSGDAYDNGSSINTNYMNTNISDLIEAGTFDEANSKWFNNDGSYNTSYAPNAIDPQLYYDADGNLRLCYGSWSGGIYTLEVDEATGEVIYPGEDADTDSVNYTDRYFGTHIAGGYTKSGEGPVIVYDSDTGYYYLYMTYGGLVSDGGYNMRLFRSTSPVGPFVDSEGNNAALSGNVDNQYAGIKLIGNYQFSCNELAYKAAGHNSSFIDDDGQMYLVYHQRFNDGTEYHEVRVHQEFLNEEGWPVVAPYENNGDKISETGYLKDEVVGNYEFINQGSATTSSMQETLNVELKDDFTVTGDVTGTWSMTDGTYYMNITIDEVTYKGVFFKQTDESTEGKLVMTFTAVGDNNECVWGSKLELDDEEATEYVADYLEGVVPDSTRTNITLPTSGAYDTSISWSSSDEAAITSEGVVTRSSEDNDVTLTARITKGDAVYTRDYVVTVIGKLDSITETPIYNYDFENVDGTTVVNSGSKTGDATLVGAASVVADDERGNVLGITNENGAIKANYLSLPTDTFSGMTTEGYTVNMWVNVDKDNSSYWEHSGLFEANSNGGYPMTRISANLYGRINANGAYADVTELSEGLSSNTWQYLTYTVSGTGIVVYLNGIEVGRADKDISACFTDDFLANMTDVMVGAGNIWSDEDIASAKFDDVSIYNTALTDKEVEALFTMETVVKVDFATLNETIDSAKALDKDDYTISSYKKLKKAIDAAEVVAANEEATQEEVDEATSELQTAIDNLVERKVTADKIKDKINSAFEELKNRLEGKH